MKDLKAQENRIEKTYIKMKKESELEDLRINHKLSTLKRLDAEYDTKYNALLMNIPMTLPDQTHDVEAFKNIEGA
jgi:hypothetical protein